MAWEDCHMKINILEIESSKLVIVRTGENSSQDNYVESHVLDVFVESTEIENGSHFSLEFGD